MQYFILILLFFWLNLAQAVTVSVKATSDGRDLGTLQFQNTQYGLLITPNLAELSPGVHGFHVHTNPSCGKRGQAAGPHLDPANSAKHRGPYRDQGHLGDLPALTASAIGKATLPVLAPRLTTQDLLGHSIIIHLGGDNYADHPESNGGGGGRFACAIVK